MHKQFPSFSSVLPKLIWENMVNCNPAAQKGLISFLYESLLSLENHSTQKIKSYWEEKLDIELTNDYWEGALKCVISSSSSARLALIQFKLLHRIHCSRSS